MMQNDEELLTVHELRTRTGLSQVEFSAKYDIPTRTVQNWEMHENDPTKGREMVPWVLRMLNRIVREDFPEAFGHGASPEFGKLER